MVFEVPSNPKLSMVLQEVGQSALQRDLDILEHWTINSNLTNWNGIHLHQGWTHARHKYKSGEDYVESSTAEKNVTKLSVGQMCALAAILRCMKHSVTSQHTSVGPGKGHHKGLEHLTYEEKLRGLRLFSIEKVLEISHCCLSIVKRGLQKKKKKRQETF